jgi:hypothetical protein
LEAAAVATAGAMTARSQRRRMARHAGIKLNPNISAAHLARDTIGGEVKAAQRKNGTGPAARCDRGSRTMTAFLPVARAGVLALGAGFALMGAGFERAYAQATLNVSYTISVARVPVGRVTWTAEIGEDSFSTTGHGEAAGVAVIAVKGKGSLAARGTVKDGRLDATSFTSDVTRGEEKSDVRMVLDHGTVVEIKAESPAPGEDRVPLTAAHRQNIVDPLTAWLIPAGTGEGLSREACNRTLPIFDGQRRFDLRLAYKRMDTAKAVKGYEGAVVVCSVAFQPIAGHRASSTLVKFLSQGRDIELWLAPVSGTLLLAPLRVSVASMLGNLVVQANEFQTRTHTASFPWLGTENRAD